MPRNEMRMLKNWHNCDVCDAKTMECLHFDGQCCKACAAFFRRTVAMNLQYTCHNDDKCPVHFEEKHICRKCRFRRCISVGMKPDLVQSKKEAHEQNNKEKFLEPRSVESTSEGAQTELLIQDSPALSSERFDSILELPPTTSTMDPSALINHYTTLESHLNDRRRIMYTNTPMIHLFNTRCECPYEKEHLRLFDYKKFVGYNRNDLSSVYDYVRNFPDFHLLTTAEKNHVFRTTCCVDGMINSAFYSIRIGYDDKRLITWNGSYISMSPVPMSGEEPDAVIHFDSPEDHIKYRSLMPTKIQQWFNLVIPLHELAPTFEEFALIKALTVWHMSYYKLSDASRQICRRQRSAILNAIHELCVTSRKGRSKNAAAERTGQLILSMTYIITQVLDLVSSYVVITFFGLFNYDHATQEIIGYQTVTEA